MRKFFLPFLFLSFLFYTQATAQDSIPNRQNIELSAGSLLSTGSSAPLWIQGNNSQRLNNDPNTFYLEANGIQPLLTKNKLELDLGFDLIARQSEKTTGDIIEGYLQANLGKFSFFGGRKEEVLGVRDTLLSVGQFVNGNNSLPIPKIALYSNDWIDVPLTKGYVQFLFYYAHGWFEKDRYIESPFLHQKYFYGRISNKKLPFALYAGLTHNVQWEGTISSSGEKLPSGLKNYKSVIFGKSTSDTRFQSDYLNAIGNHLGNYDMGVEYFNDKIKLINYWNFFYEDHSGLQVKNFSDGLTGLNLIFKNKRVIQAILIELFKTTDQNGDKYDSDGKPYFEPDNFFNNGTYNSGWSYFNILIGNPIFLLPVPDQYDTFRVKNAVKGFNIGSRGNLFNTKYTLKYTYFENHGNLFENRFVLKSTTIRTLNSIQLTLTKPLKNKYSFNTVLNYQWGSIAENALGMRVAFTKRF